MRIAVLGAGLIGTSTAVVLAKHNQSHQFCLYDTDGAILSSWASGNPHIYEPFLESSLQEGLQRNLTTSTSPEEALRNADIVFVCVGSKCDDSGVPDLTNWVSAAYDIASHVQQSCIVVESTTIPSRISAALIDILSAHESPDRKFRVVSIPAFVRRGSIVADLEAPSRLLIGGPDDAVGDVLALYSFVSKEKILHSTLWTSELSKLAITAMQAQRVSAICEKTGAHHSEVMRCVAMDSRLGAGYLKVLELNNYQRFRFVNAVLDKLHGTLRNKTVGVLGAAYKRNTSDLQDASSLFVCKEFLARGASLRIFDPSVCADDVLKEFDERELRPRVEVVRSAEEVAEGASAVVLCTDCEGFKTADWARMFGAMKRPARVFDGMGVLDRKAVESVGFECVVVGN